MAKQTIAQLFDLTGKSAVVTGGAMGIGRGIVTRLAEAGASVMIADIDINAANETAEKLKAKGFKIAAIKADVSSAADAEKVAQATVQTFGGLDILVNNAGIFPTSGFMDTTEEMWNKVLKINLTGVFLFSQAAARVMIKTGKGGRIINVASTDAIKVKADHVHYSVSKAGVVMLTKVMAMELGPHKIIVNAVAPGVTYTPGGQAKVETMRQMGGTSVEEFGKRYIEQTPLKRLADPDDCAKLVLVFASGATDFVTGEFVIADGGYFLY